jgi:hypothetical protein
MATHFAMQKQGIAVADFIVNGDDQNCLLKTQDCDRYLQFMEDHLFTLSIPKSLIGHELSV